MKKFNCARFVWIVALFFALIVILVAVIDYKIHFQYLSKNMIYFYECRGNLCVTEVIDDQNLLYSKYECGYEECPVFKAELGDCYAILNKSDVNNNILFNYRTGVVVSFGYDDYKILNNNYLIITKNKLQGIIDINNKVVVSLKYDQLGVMKDGYLTGYGLNYIVAKKNDRYGIISLKDETIVEEFVYEESQLDNVLQILSDKEKLLQSN